MQGAIRARRQEYERGGFVRWTVLDKHRQCAIGTVELFNRQAEERKAAVEQLGFAASEESITEIAHRAGLEGQVIIVRCLRNITGYPRLRTGRRERAALFM